MVGGPDLLDRRPRCCCLGQGGQSTCFQLFHSFVSLPLFWFMEVVL